MMQRLRVLFAVALLSLGIGLFGCGGSSGSITTTAAAGPDPAAPGQAPTVAPSATKGTEERAPRPVVVVSGTTARGDAFEVVTRGTGEGICLTMMYPMREEAEGGGACGDRLVPRLRTPISAWGTSKNGAEEAVDGYVSAEVASVAVEFEDDGQIQSVQAFTEMLPREVLRAGAGRSPIGFFVAFLPDGVAADGVTAVAFDSDGNELGRARFLAGAS